MFCESWCMAHCELQNHRLNAQWNTSTPVAILVRSCFVNHARCRVWEQQSNGFHDQYVCTFSLGIRVSWVHFAHNELRIAFLRTAFVRSYALRIIGRFLASSWQIIGKFVQSLWHLRSRIRKLSIHFLFLYNSVLGDEQNDVPKQYQN